MLRSKKKKKDKNKCSPVLNLLKPELQYKLDSVTDLTPSCDCYRDLKGF